MKAAIRMVKGGITLSILGAILYLFIGGFSLSETFKSNDLLSKIQGDETKMIISGVMLVEKNRDNSSMEIKADKAMVYPQSEVTELDNFQLVTNNVDSGQVVVSAARGSVDNKKAHITAQGGVVARDRQGRTMITESLEWSRNDDRITSNGQVEIFGARFVVEGGRMVARPQEGRVTLDGGVRAVFVEAQ